VLAQFALFVFAIFAVLSLIIDVGYARLTQGQMQIAADTAALEGLRARDSGPTNPQTMQADPFASDCVRRAAANRIAHWVFDDDLNAENGDPDFQYGAGPIVDVTDGETNLHALATATAGDPRVYKPDLQLNQQNAIHGDMVSGQFVYTTDPVSPEDATYARADFTPNAEAPQPPPALGACPPADEALPDPFPVGSSGSLTAGRDTAFLARVRRSNELQSGDGQIDAGVASSGPALPLVFGRATTVFGDDPAGGYSVRRDGLTVRATAIANVRPAMHIGLPQPGVPGVTSFALADTFAQTLNAVGCPVTVNPITGVILRAAGGGAVCAAVPVGTLVGRFVANPAAISTVGLVPPTAAVAVPCAATGPTQSGYGPVYSLMSSGTTRIVGFTRIGLARGACPAAAAAPFTAVAFRGVSLVAPRNATATLFDGAALPPDTQPAEVQQLLDKNLVRNGAIDYAPVLVAVLAR
jgi:hypothetical protein